MFTTNFFGSGNPSIRQFIAPAGTYYIDVKEAIKYQQTASPSGMNWVAVATGVTVTLDYLNFNAQAVEWADITGTPTTLAGYGITDPVLLNTLSTGKIFIGNGSGVATEQTMSGHATISAGGVLTLASVIVAGTVGQADKTLTIWWDAQGRVLLVQHLAIQIAESQVTGLTAALAAKLGTALASAKIFVGNGGGVAAAVSMSGDATIDNTGALTIANDAVTYAKMQNVSNTSRALGRKTAGAGDVEEITLSELLDFIGSAAQGDILYRDAATWARLAAGTSGYLLKTNGAGANPSWVAPPWSIVSKTADETVINSSTLQNDDDLFFAMAANTKYRIRARIFWDTTAAGDFKYGFAQPGAMTLVRSELITGAAASTPAFATIATSIPTSQSLTGTGVTGGYLFLDCVIHNGVNSANFQFMFSQATATADTGAVVRAGSYMEYAVT